MQYLNKHPTDVLSDTQLIALEEVIYKVFSDMHWHIDTLRYNTDNMRDEIKSLKEKMK